MPAEDDTGRLSEFAGGQHGGGGAHYPASSIPAPRQADPDFNDSASVLLTANAFSGSGLGKSDSTMRLSDPYSVAMRDTLKQSGDGTVEN